MDSISQKLPAVACTDGEVETIWVVPISVVPLLLAPCLPLSEAFLAAALHAFLSRRSAAHRKIELRELGSLRIAGMRMHAISADRNV